MTPEDVLNAWVLLTDTVQCSSGSAGGPHLLVVLPTFFFFQTSFVPALCRPGLCVILVLFWLGEKHERAVIHIKICVAYF